MFKLTQVDDLCCFLRDAERQLARTGRRFNNNVGLPPGITDNYKSLTKDELQKIARGLGLTGLSALNKAALIQTVARQYEVMLGTFTIPQIEQVLDSKNIKVRKMSRKRELTILAVVASF